jgi:coproporphyrinogen III oxidase
LNKETITEWFHGLQDRICAALEDADGAARFAEDPWERPGGGGGRTRIIQNGRVLAKGGVAFSAVYGATPRNILQALQLDEADFYATGVSIVLHPHSPMVPIIHMNVRYFEMTNGTWWFGGGIDLTPHYVDEADARHFHHTLKAVCDRHHAGFYPRFKAWADDYFYIKHRQETRGIGGIFFDRLGEGEELPKEQLFAFVQDVGEAFAPIYTHFMRKNADLPYGEAEKQWQMVRRGRYVEFNLVYDKGTKFGLDTDGRTESILMSMPPVAEWHYNLQPAPDTPEARTLAYLRKGITFIV